jgi:hypothetical protein
MTGGKKNKHYPWRACKRCQYAATKSWEKRNPEKIQKIRKRAMDRYKAKLIEQGGPDAVKRRNRNHMLWFHYRLSSEAYEALRQAQGGLCAICLLAPVGIHKRPGLYVDHDHRTGAVRGLLCHSCNSAIAFMSDSVERLAAAIGYLAKHGVQSAKQEDSCPPTVLSFPANSVGS